MIAAAVTLALAAAPLARQDLDEHDEPCEVAVPSIAYRVEPFVDLFFTVRRLAESGESIAEADGLTAAVDAARALQENLRGIEWGVIEGLLGACKDGASALRVFETLPVTHSTRRRKDFALRAPALELARALARVEPAFKEEIWPAHADEIERARERIDGVFRAREARCFEAVVRDLAFASPPLSIPVFLVHDGPFPGAVTQSDDQGRGVCFVSVRSAEGTQLFETILHEALHALDVGSPGSALDRLRERLERAGVQRGDRAWHDLPHALMFVEAAETIRRIVDPVHEHYGDRSGVYARLGPGALTVRSAWTERLDGKRELDAALDAIVRESTAPVRR